MNPVDRYDCMQITLLMEALATSALLRFTSVSRNEIRDHGKTTE